MFPSTLSHTLRTNARTHAMSRKCRFVSDQCHEEGDDSERELSDDDDELSGVPAVAGLIDDGDLPDDGHGHQALFALRDREEEERQLRIAREQVQRLQRQHDVEESDSGSSSLPARAPRPVLLAAKRAREAAEAAAKEREVAAKEREALEAAKKARAATLYRAAMVELGIFGDEPEPAQAHQSVPRPSPPMDGSDQPKTSKYRIKKKPAVSSVQA